MTTAPLAASRAAAPALSLQDRAQAARLARGYAALVAATTALIVLGALVRAHGAGLACPDWPLCFGELVPAFDLKVAFEWSHRVLAGSVTLVFLGLSLLVLLRRALWLRLRPWIALAAGALAVQIVLGGLTVLQLLASWTVSSHLVVGNGVNAGFAIIAWRLAREAHAPTDARARPPQGAALRALLVAVGLALLLQLVLGGQVSSRFAGLACDEWPACHGGVWFPDWHGARGLHLLHRLTGYALVGLLAAAALAARGSGRAAGLLRAAAVVGGLQAAVGVANVLLRIPVEVTGTHSLLAAVLVLLTTLALLEVFGRRDTGTTAL